ncbi:MULTISPECIES: MerR family transcriptional regulator [Bacillus]|uniref:MerR family transcriptional regulator n=3 Tax=Bacillus TaxID=1386 RepID=A0A0M4FUD4_9BACI|nr:MULTISPECIES: MerR family transcriptional regulator [Bacillus]ALC81968.1 MerR family transcriptional regulator [Bacillus gobiensis]MBP1083300.1 DNA-binding transcriptional MerR regulator [Bacillus capparidis]MED1097735.1 MerR family transcriptional regulator [Bacillus capparidis]
MTYSMKYVMNHLNVSANTLRYYEKEGILKNISRDSSGRRIYNDENIESINFIRILRLTGMSIANIRKYFELYELGDDTLLQRKEMMMQHKSRVKNKINEYLNYLDVISYKAAMYELKEKEYRQKI